MILCAVTLLMFACVIVHGNTNTTDSVLLRLQHHIVSRQNVLIRNSSALFDVAVEFIPLAIVGLDEETQVFSFSGILIAGWMDPAAAWDPLDFNDTYAVTMDTSLLWTPTLSAMNSVNRIGSTLKEDAYISSIGYVMAFYADAYKTSCVMDTSYFPFDEQTCIVLLFPSGRYQFFTVVTDVQVPEYFFRSNEWRLISLTLQNKTYNQIIFGQSFLIASVSIRFKLKRYSTFYVMSILAPIGILSVMNACVFLLPVESGEKMSFLVSILVSYAMFLNFIYSTMPRSDSLSRLTIYLMLVISQSCMSIVSTIYLLNIYHGGYAAVRSRTYPLSKVKPEKPASVDSTTNETVPKPKIFARFIDRAMFVLFSFSALLSLMVFADI